MQLLMDCMQLKQKALDAYPFVKNQLCEPVSKRPTLANLCVGLKFQASKYSMYSSG